MSVKNKELIISYNQDFYFILFFCNLSKFLPWSIHYIHTKSFCSGQNLINSTTTLRMCSIVFYQNQNNITNETRYKVVFLSIARILVLSFLNPILRSNYSSRTNGSKKHNFRI